MAAAVRLVTSAAALVLVGVIGVGLLPASTPSGAGAPASASPSSGASPSPDGGATEGPVALPFVQLAAGRHSIDVPLYASFRTYVVMGVGSGPDFGDPIAVVRVTFEVPAGWSGNGEAIARDADSPAALGVSPWTVGGLYRTPCRPSPGQMQDPPLLRSVDGLTGAMISWWRGSDLSPHDWPPKATGWADGSLGGLAGRYLEVTSDRGIAGCNGGQNLLCEDQRGRQRISTVPGELDRLWILDASRHVILSPEVIASGIYGADPEMQVLPLVIDATSQPGASPEDLADLQAIVDSIAIEPLASTRASPSASPSVIATATPAASASASSTAIGTGPVTAGRHHIDVHLSSFAGGVFAPGGRARVSFDVLAGWRGEDGWAIAKGDPGSPSGLVMAPVTVHRVYIEPCDWSRGNLADGPLTRTLDGLAEALTAWWGVGFASGPTLPPGVIFAPALPRATRPARITLAGFESRYVEVRTPADLDLATCDEGRYVLFRTVDRQRHAQGAGELARLWIVRVDGADPAARGGLLVIDAASQPGASPEDLAELQAIVDSIDIELLPPGRS